MSDWIKAYAETRVRFPGHVAIRTHEARDGITFTATTCTYEPPLPFGNPSPRDPLFGRSVIVTPLPRTPATLASGDPMRPVWADPGYRHHERRDFRCMWTVPYTAPPAEVGEWAREAARRMASEMCGSYA